MLLDGHISVGWPWAKKKLAATPFPTPGVVLPLVVQLVASAVHFARTPGALRELKVPG